MDQIEILAMGVHSNSTRRFGAYHTAPGAVKKGPAVDVSAYGRLRATLTLHAVPGGGALQEPLVAALEAAEADKGPWHLLTAFDLLDEAGSTTIDVALRGARFVRVSWGWSGPSQLEFGVTALATERVAEVPAAPVAPDPRRELSDKALARQCEQAATKLGELDAAVRKLAGEYRSVEDQFKAAPTPLLAGERDALRQLAENAGATHSEYHKTEWYPLERERDRRASVRRLAELRPQVAAMSDYRAAADRVGEVVGAFLGALAARLDEMQLVIATRHELLEEINALEADPEFGSGVVHQMIDMSNVCKLVCEQVAQRIARHAGTSPHSLASDLRQLMQLARAAQRATPTAQPLQAGASS